MRTLIILVAGLLAVACEKGGEITIGEPPKAKRVKDLTPEQKRKALRDSVIGEYERKEDGDTFKNVLLENGILERYTNGKKSDEHKWKIVDGEIHATLSRASVWIVVYRINTDKSKTPIARIADGKRTDYPKENLHTYKKLK